MVRWGWREFTVGRREWNVETVWAELGFLPEGQAQCRFGTAQHWRPCRNPPVALHKAVQLIDYNSLMFVSRIGVELSTNFRWFFAWSCSRAISRIPYQRSGGGPAAALPAPIQCGDELPGAKTDFLDDFSDDTGIADADVGLDWRTKLVWRSGRIVDRNKI